MKKILFDTSFLIAAMVEDDDFHESAEKWYQQAVDKKFIAYMALHSYAELYNTLTIYPTTPKISPSTAWLLIQQFIDGIINVIALSHDDYRQTLQQMSTLGIRGGTIYDSLIAKAAQLAEVDELFTFNSRHFELVLPEKSIKIIVPQ